MLVVSGGRVDASDSECCIETTMVQVIFCFHVNSWFRHLHSLALPARASVRAGASVRARKPLALLNQQNTLGIYYR